MRCRECGAEHAADVRGCPACDADAGEALPVVDLDDTELGIRTEDRYAYVPPGPQWIRRRVHDNSKQIPIAILIGLAVFFVIGGFFPGSTRGRPEAPRQGPPQRRPRLAPTTPGPLLLPSA